MPDVGIYYCGGCNPRYDRVGLVAEIEIMFPRLTFSPVSAGGAYTAVLVICGCLARCASLPKIPLSRERIYYLSGRADFEKIKPILTELHAGAISQ